MNKKTHLKWLDSTHLHCSKCGSKLRFLTRLAWNDKHGVRAIGICPKCHCLTIEAENHKYTKIVRVG